MEEARRPEPDARHTERRVLHYMDERGLWPAAGPLLVGVSGGPDSSALLLLLSQVAPRRGVALVAAYFDHRLRGEAASRDERSKVEELAARAGVRLVSGRGDVRMRARSERRSLEDAARRARYDFLATAAREAGAGLVAVGHTTDDQAETVLLHLVRGSGLTGIAGMAARSRWPSPGEGRPALVRPVLHLTRAETEAYCRAAGFAPLEDLSNRSPAFLRNRVRAELLPLLRAYNPRVREALVRLAEAARADLDYLEGVAALAVEAGREGVSLRVAAFRDLPPSPRSHAVRIALERLLGDLQGVGQRHLAAVTRLLLDGRTGDSLDLPRGVRARRGRDRVLLSFAAPPTPLPPEAVPLPVPGQTAFGPWLCGAGPAGQGAVAGGGEAIVDADAVAGGLVLRRRRPGDRFHPAGLSRPKKLQDFLVDAHVPREERDNLVLFESEQGIVWVAGLRVAAWALPRPERPAARLSCKSLAASRP